MHEVKPNLTFIIPALLVAISGALSTWLWKLDDRQFEFQRDVITREEFTVRMGRLENRLEKRFDVSDAKQQKLFDLLREMNDKLSERRKADERN